MVARSAESAGTSILAGRALWGGLWILLGLLVGSPSGAQQDLEDAFEAWEKDPGPREWRTHFHVPVFLDDLGDFKTTRFAIEDALKFHRENKLSPQLEIETYTWDVLPDHLKTGDIVDYVVMEIEWVREQLLGKQ